MLLLCRIGAPWPERLREADSSSVVSDQLSVGLSPSLVTRVLKPVCFVFERARAPRHFLLGKGHPMRKL